MPPFTVPYAPSGYYQPNFRLADLIRQTGADAAAARERQGQASAQVWGNVGNAIQNTVGSVMQAQAEAPKLAAAKAQAQLEQIKLKEAQGGQDDLKALDDAYNKPGGRQAIIDALPGHLKGTVLQQFEQQDKLHSEAQKAQEEADKLATEAFADTAASLKAHGYEPAAAQLAISDLKAKYQGNPTRLSQLQQAEAAIRQNPTPDTVKAFADPLLAASTKRVELGQGQQKIDIDAASKAETDRHNLEQERISGLTVGREQLAAAETARHNQATEALAAKSAMETGRHNRQTEAAANPFGALSGASATPTTAGPTGEALLKSLPPEQAAQIRGLAEGRMPFPTGMSYAKLQPLIQMVSQYDPSFDAANYNARAKARTDLTSPSGTGGKTINALNTAIQHAGKLSDLIETLDNTEYSPVNAVVNPLKSMTGSTKVTNYKAVAPQLAKEIERAWRGAGGSQADIQALIDSIGSNMGRQQQREALQQFVDLAKGKLDSTEQQRDNVLGPIASKTIPVLFEQNKSIMDKISQRAGGSSASEVEPVRAKAEQVLQQNGHASDPASVDTFLKNNPSFK